MTDTIDNKTAIARHIDRIEETLLKEMQQSWVDIIEHINGYAHNPTHDALGGTVDYIQQKVIALQARISSLHVIMEAHGNG